MLVVDPDRIVADSPRGRSDLYVALTRATSRLGVIHPGQDLPTALRGLSAEDGADDLWSTAASDQHNAAAAARAPAGAPGR